MQVNYHGPYILTRLLEPVLIASKPSRVVNVASVEHRIGYIKDIRKFMFDAKKFLYSETKLGNVLLTYEHQRRLGSYGVQVCCYFNTAMIFAYLQWLTGVSLCQYCNGICISAVAHMCVYQYCLCCPPVLPCYPPVLSLLSTSTASVVYQYCLVVYQYWLCCLPVLPSCLPLDPGMLLSYTVTVNPLKTLCILIPQPALQCALLLIDICWVTSKTDSLILHIS